MTSMTFGTKGAKAKLERIEAALGRAPRTANQLCDVVFMSRSTTALYLQHLMREPKRVYIASWIHWGKGSAAPVYAAGNLKDAPESQRAAK